MMRTVPNIFFVSAEVAPFAAAGGLGQVSYFFPRALKKAGADVSIFMPKYGIIDEKKFHIEPYISNLRIPTGSDEPKDLICNIKVRWGNSREPTVYFLENMEYFEQRANVYGYTDDHIRFALLSKGALEFIKTGKVDPTILHCNDWHTGYCINYFHTEYQKLSLFRGISSVFTIHNLKSQGTFDFRFATPTDFDDGKSPVAPFFSEALRKQNPMKRGILYADLVNTVSENYVSEMMTSEYGEGLQELVKEVRVKVFGILNGLDYVDFDPSEDHVIKQRFSWKTLMNRLEDKKDLQKKFNLTQDLSAPIISYVGRLADQKGLDLIREVVPNLLLEHNVQFIILGTGDQKYREFFSKLEKEFPGRVGTHLMHNAILPRKIFAGSDLLILPSRFEPAGIVVIEAMRYGTVPIVRCTGGLADIVTDFNPELGVGNGFSFSQFHELSFYGAIVRALQVYRNKKTWNALVKKVMKENFSWDHSAQGYLALYNRAIEFRKDRQSPIQSEIRQALQL